MPCDCVEPTGWEATCRGHAGSTGRFVEAESVVGTWAGRLRGWRGEEGGGAVLSTAAPARVESGRLSRAESPRSSALAGSESTLQSS